MGLDAPVEIRRIEDMAMVRILCGSAPAERIIAELREKLGEEDLQKTVVVLEKLQSVDASLSSFLSDVDDVLQDVKNPLIIFDQSGLFQTMAEASRPYLFSRDESDAFRRVAAEFVQAGRKETSGRIRVLIIEDDPDVMEFLVDLLGADDRFELKTATSGFEGGMATAGFRPHLILLDIMLPDLDGRDVCRILRENPDVGDPKIIAITALSREKDVSEIISAGVDDYLGKPFRINVLLKKIERLLSRENLEPPAR
jgi:CheY-like chemotaxis protein